MTQYGFFFRYEPVAATPARPAALRIACKDWNEIEPGAEKWMTVYELVEKYGTFPNLRLPDATKPLAAPAREPRLALRPARAVPCTRRREYGAVLVDQDKCTGCRKCYDACPYGAPKFATDEPTCKMSKCDMCVDRLADGKQPACTMSCPLRAFDFGPLDELMEKYGDVRYCEGMPSPDATKPGLPHLEPAREDPAHPYDAEEAIALNQQRGDLGTMFESEEDLTVFEEGTIGRDGLKMKHGSNIELMRATRNDMA